jgi:predicted ribosome quality control (RQC) complex YloA/Tae2 family protein
MLLKVGRHLRPRRHFKLIIGREEGENLFLEGYRRRYAHLRPASHPGPMVLVDGAIGEDDLDLVARLAARFTKGRDAPAVTLEFTDREGRSQHLEAAPLPADQVPRAWYI